MTTTYYLSDYRDVLVAFLEEMRRQAPKEWALVETVVGYPIEPQTILPSDVTITDSKRMGQVHGVVTFGGFRFGLYLTDCKWSTGKFTGPNRLHSDMFIYALLANSVADHYALSASFEYSPTEGIELSYNGDGSERWKRAIKAMIGPIRRNALAVLRGHRRYLKNAAEYDRLEQVMKLKVKS